MPFAARLAMLFASALLALGAAPAAPRQESLSDLLARMRVHSGPVWSAHVHSTSRIGGAGHEIALRTDAQGVRFASYQCTNTLCEGTYFDGERLYSIDMNGTALPDAGGADPYLRARRTIASLAFLAPDFTQTGGRIIDDGYTSISGVTYRTMLIVNGDAVPMLVFVDPASATVKYARDINGDNTFEYRDYTPFDGGRFVMPMEVLRNGTLLERYDRREAVTGTFAIPRGPQATFANGPVTVRTNLDRIIPVFSCTLGGVATMCLLDSGNSGLSISLSLAERLGLPSIGSFQVRGLGDYATEVVHAGALGIGSMTFAPANYVVLPDIDRFGYEVVLGADMFAATSIELDQAQHRLVFGAMPAPGGIVVPLAFEDFVPVVDVHLGSVPTELAVDTGDESSINLAYDFYQQHHDLFSATSERPVSGVGGSSIELLGTIPQVRIGALDVASAAIGATRTLQGTAFGHVGAGLLARYVVTIDYQSGELQFAPPDAGP